MEIPNTFCVRYLLHDLIFFIAPILNLRGIDVINAIIKDKTMT